MDEEDLDEHALALPADPVPAATARTDALAGGGGVTRVLRVLARHGFLGALRGKGHLPSPVQVREACSQERLAGAVAMTVVGGVSGKRFDARRSSMSCGMPTFQITFTNLSCRPEHFAKF